MQTLPDTIYSRGGICHPRERDMEYYEANKSNILLVEHDENNIRVLYKNWEYTMFPNCHPWNIVAAKVECGETVVIRNNGTLDYLTENYDDIAKKIIPCQGKWYMTDCGGEAAIILCKEDDERIFHRHDVVDIRKLGNFGGIQYVKVIYETGFSIVKYDPAKHSPSFLKWWK